ncbi:hypothetical protein Pelo_13851 [Pelomyxa schiedti]|nr:hypothetical protein Pelo_13851 [Pelomyxa schiedti]
MDRLTLPPLDDAGFGPRDEACDLSALLEEMDESHDGPPRDGSREASPAPPLGWRQAAPPSAHPEPAPAPDPEVEAEPQPASTTTSRSSKGKSPRAPETQPGTASKSKSASKSGSRSKSGKVSSKDTPGMASPAESDDGGGTAYYLNEQVAEDSVDDHGQFSIQHSQRCSASASIVGLENIYQSLMYFNLCPFTVGMSTLFQYMVEAPAPIGLMIPNKHLIVDTPLDVYPTDLPASLQIHNIEAASQKGLFSKPLLSRIVKRQALLDTAELATCTFIHNISASCTLNGVPLLFYPSGKILQIMNVIIVSTDQPHPSNIASVELPGSIRQICISLDDNVLFVACSTYYFVYVFSVDLPSNDQSLSKVKFEPLHILPFQKEILCTSISQVNGIPCIAVACGDKSLFYWDSMIGKKVCIMETEQPVETMEPATDAPSAVPLSFATMETVKKFMVVAFGAHCRLLIVASAWNVFTLDFTYAFSTVKKKTDKKEILTIKNELLSTRITAMAVHPRNPFIFSVSTPSCIYLLDSRKRQQQSHTLDTLIACPVSGKIVAYHFRTVLVVSSQESEQSYRLPRVLPPVPLGDQQLPFPDPHELNPVRARYGGSWVLAGASAIGCSSNFALFQVTDRGDVWRQHFSFMRDCYAPCCRAFTSKACYEFQRSRLCSSDTLKDFSIVPGMQRIWDYMDSISPLKKVRCPATDAFENNESRLQEFRDTCNFPQTLLNLSKNHRNWTIPDLVSTANSLNDELCPVSVERFEKMAPADVPEYLATVTTTPFGTHAPREQEASTSTPASEWSALMLEICTPYFQRSELKQMSEEASTEVEHLASGWEKKGYPDPPMSELLRKWNLSGDPVPDSPIVEPDAEESDDAESDSGTSDSS